MSAPNRIVIDFDETGLPNIQFLNQEFPVHWLHAVVAQLNEQAMLPIRMQLSAVARAFQQQQARDNASPILKPGFNPPADAATRRG